MLAKVNEFDVDERPCAANSSKFGGEYGIAKLSRLTPFELDLGL
jgi:hypothetical protein